MFALFVIMFPKSAFTETGYAKEILRWNIFILKYGLGWDTLPNGTLIVAHNCLPPQASDTPVMYELFMLSMHTHEPARSDITLGDVVARNMEETHGRYHFFLKESGSWGYSAELKPIAYFVFIRGAKEKHLPWGHLKWEFLSESAFRNICVRSGMRFVPPGFFGQ
ncbi:MAG: hypothetical protein COW88_03295 [Candidatus Lloydbacteria bacterium CG22_combo_CG10-13_8_21_14_all_47_15]|uniref:Uncharacterized protein n=1 Tax=Candidatus Lloydbacteria bacterium CG22_combo_CG10-13_8_21_14_all_47_15 TaxID=1974635 RepID=A0A2H0CTC4_9BACT|nr:MAG: hypothetical protein COW88_03295 [Candidatus Lloydbacteria bacterium CG22_combo_CG10-13_8_21_14_all_47_15]